jgi:hypothetical protein
VTIVIALFLAVGACGGPAMPPSATAVDAQFSTPEAEVARERVPDLWGAADRARSDARAAAQAGDADAADDHATRAR